MSARGVSRSTGRLAAVARSARAQLHRGGRRGALALLLAAALGVFGGAIAGAPAFASGESGGEGGASPGESTSTSNCPTPNPPNQLTLVAGTPQTTTLDSAFASGLQAALTNSDGCAVTGAAGTPVTFSAPASGAGGRFSTSTSNTATVGADSSGAVAAPTFTANADPGSYSVIASSPYGSISFSLTNTAAGIPARLTALPPGRSSTRVTAGFPEPLQVRVLDADGNPVAGATVTFTLGSATAGSCGANAAASASFAGTGNQATSTTGVSGLATSPTFTADTAAGRFTATASLASSGAGGAESAGRAAAPSVAPVSFALANLPGKPAKVAPGVGSTQSTTAGSAFPIRLAVSVTDAQKNPVPGAHITFSAPRAGASGHFTIRSRPRRPHHDHVRVAHASAVTVKTNGCGIAVAPAFTADDRQGGYIVKATAEHGRPAAFALVNEAPGQSS